LVINDVFTGHCQRFAPQYIKFVAEHAGSGMQFEAVDCVAERDLCAELHIESYPTVRGFGFGKEIEEELAKMDIHTIDKVGAFVKSYQDRGTTKKHLRDNEIAPHTSKEVAATTPKVSHHIGDMHSNHENEKWVNKYVTRR